MLVDGKWDADWQSVQGTDEEGGFVRQTSSFRNFVTPDGEPAPTGEGGFKAEAGRYHLYVGLICPWASRTLIARKLKGLEDAISVSVVNPRLTDQGWRFNGHPGATADHLGGGAYMHEIYTHADPHYTGRATIPVLWDKAQDTMVNNGSADILRILNSGFGTIADETVDLYPEQHRAEIDAWNDRLYESFNNGVYRAGFATTQSAYEGAFHDVFSALAALEAHLAGRRFLVGEAIIEADIRLFVTLVRFDAAYHGIFKCNLKRIADYDAVSAYLKGLLADPVIADTVSIDHIKQGYYSVASLNPTGIVPLGPEAIA